MIFQSQISTVNQAIRVFSGLAKRAIKNGITFGAHLVAHFPTYAASFMRHTWAVFTTGLRLGKNLGIMLLKATKYIAEHFGEIVRAMFDLSITLIKKLPSFAKSLFNLTVELLTAMKDLVVYAATHLPEMLAHMRHLAKKLATACYNVTSWFMRHGTDLAANLLGFAIGIVIAPLQLLYESLSSSEVDQQRQAPPARNVASAEITILERPAAMVHHYARASSTTPVQSHLQSDSRPGLKQTPR